MQIKIFNDQLNTKIIQRVYMIVTNYGKLY
jgi:hypothetical protein